MIRRFLSLPLHVQILSALVVAVIVGQLTRLGVGWENFGFVRIFGVPVESIYEFIGRLFLNGLRMLIVPLIASAVITAIVGLGERGAFGRLGLKTLAYYLTTSTFAILIGLSMVNLIRPGIVNGQRASDLMGLAADPSQVHAAVGERDAGDVVEVFIRMIPENVVAASADNGAMLAVIFFSLLFGYFMTRVRDEPGQALRAFWEGVYQVMLQITDLVMRFAPLGVFGLVAGVSAGTAPADFAALFTFFLTVLSALAIHFLLTLPLILVLVGRVKPWKVYRGMIPALTTAFSTSSSAATLPVTLDCLQRNLGVRRETASFVSPLGATVNMDGTALYECVAVIFIAQVYGVTLGIGGQIIVVVLALLTSIGVAGVPSASLVAIVVILTALGLPAEAIGILMVFDRILDMCRTSVNVFSDACGSVVIARTEGEETTAV